MSEIRDLPTEEIEQSLAETRRALFNLRFQRESEQLEKPAEMRKARKDIARLLTGLREREVEERTTAEAAEPSAQSRRED